MPQLAKKLFNGREVKSEKTFTWGKKTVFGALYEAVEWLHENGYHEGSLSGSEPIGFVKGMYTIPWKWHNLSKDQKASLAGIMISENFREGDIKIMFFED